MVLAALPLPGIGYYSFLRFITFVGTATIIYYCYTDKQNKWIPFLALILILFNPFIPFHLGKTVWGYANIASAVFFAVLWFNLKRIDSK